MCVLAVNILNQKIYILVWFWLVALSVITGLWLLFRAATVLSPQFRTRLLQVLSVITGLCCSSVRLLYCLHSSGHGLCRYRLCSSGHGFCRYCLCISGHGFCRYYLHISGHGCCRYCLRSSDPDCCRYCIHSSGHDCCRYCLQIGRAHV